MRYKHGVDVFGLRSEIVAILPVIDSVIFDLMGCEATITSACDSHHNTIVHSIGCAVDIRTRYNNTSQQWSDKAKAEVLTSLKNALPVGFDIVVECDHLHLEIDRRRLHR